MIFLFHSFIILMRHFIRRRRWNQILKEIQQRRNSIEEEINKHTSFTRDAELNVHFDPPVYKQRYEAIQKVLLDERWRSDIHKIIDFGCAEFGLFVFLKRLFGLHEILEVDIDEELLRNNIVKLRPLTVDYLKRRSEPLTIKVFRGSIAHPDPVLLNADAVIGVEIIEHLYPDELEALPYNIFAYIKPRIAVFTTPNIEFNEVFQRMEGFRHDDHKFEWTREQFESWAYNITARFPNYVVSFAGIGLGPVDTRHLGHCSQMAIFARQNEDPLVDHKPQESSRKSVFVQIERARLNSEQNHSLSEQAQGDCRVDPNYGICTHCSYSQQLQDYETSDDRDSGNFSYKLIESIEYPYEVCTLSAEEILTQEVKYKIHTLGRIFGRFFNDDLNRSEIPLEEIMDDPEGPYISKSEIKKVISNIGYRIEECNAYESQTLLPCIIYEPVMESSSSPTSEGNPSDNAENWQTEDEGHISDWDNPSDNPREFKWPTQCPEIPKSNRSTTYASEVLFDIIRSLESSNEVADNAGISSDMLIDSGYQKSVSNLEGSPQTPFEFEGIFEDHFVPHENGKVGKAADTQGNFSENAINAALHLPRVIPKPTAIQNYILRHAVTDTTQIVLDEMRKPERTKDISEVDKHDSGLKTPPKLPIKKKDLKEPVPGSSKRRKSKKPDDESSVHEAARFIAECVVSNALNRVEDPHQVFIEDVRVVQENEAAVEENGPVAVMENGDLANNNRDVEGNNYPDEAGNLQEEHAANVINENIDVQNAEDIRNEDFQNRNDGNVVRIVEAANAQDQEEEPVSEGFQEDNDSDVELAFASREALFDPNSQTDLLEDLDIPPATGVAAAAPEDVQQTQQQTVILLGVLRADEDDGVMMPARPDPFPNWLLQLLGAEYVEDGNQHDEPHFYCQGDGIGVHPSVIEVDIEEEPSSSEDSSSNTTNGDPQAENTVSEQEVGSLPDDNVENQPATTAESRTESETSTAVAEKAGPSNNESTEEFFDTVEDAPGKNVN